MSLFDKNVPDLPGTWTPDSPVVDAGRRVRRQFVELDLERLPIDELLNIRSQVEQRLPAKSLKDLDLAKELVLQVLALQAMQQRALEDDDTPVNQLAQAANSLSAALTNLVKLQTDVYNSERFKRVEQILIETLQALPAAQQEAFLGKYEEMLGGVEK